MAEDRPPAGRRESFLIPRLALSDMRHEAVLTACMIVAVVAILTPLMLLMGLRHGSIETLRQRLVENPSYREIWPGATLSLDDAWFAGIRARPEVEFVLPTILRGASVIGVRKPDGPPIVNFDLIPTAAGDPLLLQNGAGVPGDGEVVLSRAAAQKLEVAAGEPVELEVSRQREGRRERETLAATVSAVLPFEADGLERVYAPFDFAVAIEQYREGLAVPKYQWPGGKPAPYLSFDGAIVASAGELSRLDQSKLRIGTGFAAVEPLSAERFTALTGRAAPAGIALYDVKTLTKAATNDNLTQLRNKLRGMGGVMLPYVEPQEIDAGGQMLRVVGLSVDGDAAALLEIDPTPWGGYDGSADNSAPTQVLLPESRSGELEAKARIGEQELAFPLEIAGSAATPTVPLELLATLRTARDRAIAWDAAEHSFVLARRGYYGFRLFTRTIDAVPALYRDLVRDGLEVDAHVQDIERIQVLDQGLMRLFLLIATVGVVGGSGAMVASLYAAVDRKKRELGVMRLIGFSRRDVSGFPIYQGLTLASLAVVIGALVFLLFAGVINASFAGEFRPGERLCYLPTYYYAIIFGFTLIATFLSSLVAARRATQIEPAEAIREE